MRKFALLSFFVAVLSVQQVISLRIPLNKRSNFNATATENNTLALALSLEHLEVAFYTRGLHQYNVTDFENAGLSPLVYQRYHEIKQHEIAHVDLLTALLGENAPEPCKYSFPFNSVEAFVNLSLVLEGVGASAYTGAMQNLTTPELVTAAASILSTEARQSSFLGTDVVARAAPWGTAFETPISADDAFTLASQFTVSGSCPSTTPSLGLQAFPAFNLTGPSIPGQNVTVQSPINSTKPTFIAFLSGNSSQFVPIDENQNVTIPVNVSGQVYAIATNATEISTNTTVAGPFILLVETNSTGALIN